MGSGEEQVDQRKDKVYYLSSRDPRLYLDMAIIAAISREQAQRTQVALDEAALWAESSPNFFVLRAREPKRLELGTCKDL